MNQPIDESNRRPVSLDNIRIVLVRPTHPGNIGAAARAMKTMALPNLWLVAPSRFPSPQAVAMAAGADDVLTRAHVTADLDAAIAECRTVFGSSARSRRIGWPTLDPRAAAARLIQAAREGPVAILFGQERAGLTNEELDRCHALVQIPANPAYSSLNVASAVQLLAYELYVAAQAAPALPAGEHPPATAEELQRFYRHLEEVLVSIRFLDPENPRLLMRRLMRLFNRAAPDRNDINILRGILTAVEQARKLDKNTRE